MILSWCNFLSWLYRYSRNGCNMNRTTHCVTTPLRVGWRWQALVYYHSRRYHYISGRTGQISRQREIIFNDSVNLKRYNIQLCLAIWPSLNDFIPVASHYFFEARLKGPMTLLHPVHLFYSFCRHDVSFRAVLVQLLLQVDLEFYVLFSSELMFLVLIKAEAKMHYA